MKEHLGSRHGLVFQQDWKQYCSRHCRCYAVVQYGWGTGIQTLRPKLNKSTWPQLANKVCEEEGFLETVESRNQRQIQET